MTPLRLGVVGVGHLGKEHARILSQMAGAELVGIADVNPAQAEAVALRCGTRAYGDYHPLLSQVDAAVVVVPTVHHHAVALDFLRRGIPVLVEKPLAPTVEQADELLAVARQQRTVLQVGHIERFNPAFEELQRRPFQPKFLAAERVGPFTGRSTDIGAVLDLMIHDLDLLLTLTRSPVRSVEALGLSVLGGHEDVAQARVTFASGCVAELRVSRVSTTPSRRLHAWGPEGFATIDFAAKRLTLVQPSEELRRLCAAGPLEGAALARVKADLHTRHLQALELDCQAPADQLTRELQDFVHCVRTGERPRVDGEAGRDAVALACRVLESLRGHHWEGDEAGPTGPCALPLPRGPLFTPFEGGRAA